MGAVLPGYTWRKKNHFSISLKKTHNSLYVYESSVFLHVFILTSIMSTSCSHRAAAYRLPAGTHARSKLTVMAAETDLLSHISECKCGLDKCVRERCVQWNGAINGNPAAKSYQPRNNEAMFKAEIRQPHSPELLVQLFINSSECLRTHSEEEDGGAERCV